ncbi:MAG: glycoside hydrolase, partial [Anaerolineae bacterium]
MDQMAFKNPPKTFRAAPFWSWNDDLDPEELVRQVGLMDEAGWGGFFMHSRVGLVTPYLSEQWMECVRATVAEAKRRGMGAYLYDEDKWPSGFAGGLVPAQKREYRNLALVCKVDNRPAVIEESVALF